MSLNAAASLFLWPAAAIAGTPDELVALGGEVAFETAHYAVYLAGGAQGAEAEARDLGAALEAAVPRFEELMQERARFPNRERIPVRILADREAWLARIRSDEVEPPAGCDYVFYAPELDSIYLYRMPTAHQTRALALHGAFQRFHCKCRPKNRDLVRTWFVMGLADHLALHQWDGEKLHLGTLPIVAMNDLPAQALVLLDPERFDPERLFDEGLGDGAICFALVRYLIEFEGGRYRQPFEKLALGHRGSKLSPATYAERLGSPLDHAPALYSWLAQRQQPMAPILGVWEDRGGGLVIGEPVGERHALAILKSPATELAVRVRTPASPRFQSGVAFGYEDPQHRWAALVLGEEIVVHQQVELIWNIVHRAPLARPAANGIDLRVELGGGTARVFAQGQPVGEWSVEGEGLGVACSYGPVEFDELRWR